VRSVTIKNAGHRITIDARHELLAILRDVLGTTATVPAA
jgi:hypothetical protein